MKVKDSIRHFIHFYHINEVFTPSSVAKLNYVHRKELEREFDNIIDVPGRQIIVYGKSGSGKTTLIRKLLYNHKKNFVRTQCESTSSFETLMLSAFDELNLFYVHKKKTNKTYKLSDSICTEYKAIGAKIEEVRSHSSEEESVRILPPQLTPQKLSRFLGEIDAVWLIEDFHKIADAEKKRLADVFKIFIDESNDYETVKIICIGAVGSADEMLQLDPNLQHRVSEFKVPLLDDAEIKEIVENGCSLMRVRMDESLIEKIVTYSNHLGAIAHQMCYDLCCDKGIKHTKILHAIHIEGKKFKVAINAYLKHNEDTFKQIYDASVSKKLHWYILKTLDTQGDGLFFEEIKNRVNKNRYKKIYNDEEIKNALVELSSSSDNVIIFNANANKYYISNPFWKAFIKIQMAVEKENINKRKTPIIYNQKSPDAELFNIILSYIENIKKE